MGDDFDGFVGWASWFVERASWFVERASLPVFYIYEAGKMPAPQDLKSPKLPPNYSQCWGSRGHNGGEPRTLITVFLLQFSSTKNCICSFLQNRIHNYVIAWYESCNFVCIIGE